MLRPPLAFHGAFDEQAAQTPGAAASVAWSRDARCSFTYEDVCRRSFVLADGVRRLLGAASLAHYGHEVVLAIQLPRIHPDFVPVLLAASRCGLPFVLLSTDLPDKGLEHKRNELIMGHFQPVLHITDGAASACVCPRTVTIDDVINAGAQSGADVSGGGDAVAGVAPGGAFCFMFTGGTQRTKAVMATHAMILHERQAYKDLGRPQSRPVVLAHTSVYWGASALGQLSIALAFGGCVVWTEAGEVADLRRCIAEETVTVLGLVPDHLDLLAPLDPAAELPNVEIVFTWGERLPRRLAERWRAHPCAVLRELLIATEYWLCLWADPLGDGVLRGVSGTELLVLTADGTDAKQGELGELCIAGPMVMAGYHSRPGGLLEPVTDEVFYEEASRRFFRTRDLVRRLPGGGVVYKGRADMMVKDKGKWVDMLAVEDALAQVSGVRVAKIIPDPAQEHYHAFVALDGAVHAHGGALDATAVLDAVRAALPARTQLWQLPELPRHPVTRKVDANRLKRMIASGSSNWPLEAIDPGSATDPGQRRVAAQASMGPDAAHAAPDAPAALSSLVGKTPEQLAERLYTKLWSHAAWTIGTAALTWAVAVPEAFTAQAGAALVYACLSHMASSDGDTARGNRAQAMCNTTWAVMIVAISPPVSLDSVARIACSYFSFTYGWLTLTYCDDARGRSWLARRVMLVVDEIPLWKIGTLTFGFVLSHVPGPFGVAFSALLAVSAMSGFLIAAWRRRIFAWPTVFWGMGIGHQARHDSSRWVNLGFSRSCRWIANQLWSGGVGLAEACLARLWVSVPPVMLHEERASTPAENHEWVTYPEAEQASYWCCRCWATLGARWPAKASSGGLLCDPCAAVAIAEEEEEALAWVTAEMQAAAGREPAFQAGGRSLKRKFQEVDWYGDGSGASLSDMPVDQGEAPSELLPGPQRTQNPTVGPKKPTCVKSRSGAHAFADGAVPVSVPTANTLPCTPPPLPPPGRPPPESGLASPSPLPPPPRPPPEIGPPAPVARAPEVPPHVPYAYAPPPRKGEAAASQDEHRSAAAQETYGDTQANLGSSFDPSLDYRWWYNCLVTTIDIPSDVLALQQGASADRDACAPCTEEQRAVMAVVEEIEPLLKPVRPTTVLLGLDSLRIARLANAIRSRWLKALTAAQVREARTVDDLVVAIAAADPVAPASAEASAYGDSHSGRPAAEAQSDPGSSGREYAVWYSPGQATPMGHWVLRTEEPLDQDACLAATCGLVERHAALRAVARDPIRYTSFLYDCAALFTMYGPLMESGSALARCARRLISWSLTYGWPRLSCPSREEVYGRRLPDKVAPYNRVRILGGQTEFERELKQRRSNLTPPGEVTSYELLCYLEDVWAFESFKGRFAIVRCPQELQGSAAVAGAPAQLVYVDVASKEWGVLVPPGDERWQHPPYGFPALYFARLSSGAAVWFRLEGAGELRICYIAVGDPTVHHLMAFRSAPRREISAREPVVVSYLGFCMMHCWADGNCYLPLAQDFVALYSAARRQQEGVATPAPPLPPAARVPFEELERRLFDTFHLRTTPMRCSIRGSLFQYAGAGYGHTIGLEGETIAAITKAALRYHVPLDIALLGLVTCAMARADDRELVEFTLYAPMRDGAAEAMALGLFADWRDIAVSADFQLATVLGTMLQLAHKIQHRQWSVFNALRKPDRTVVNIQPLDVARRESFVNLGENMWKGGDVIGKTEQRAKEMNWARQPASFTIEQQDSETWWILMEAAVEVRPPRWTRRFLAAFAQDVRALVGNPLVPVHGRPLPSDEELLVSLSRAGGW